MSGSTESCTYTAATTGGQEATFSVPAGVSSVAVVATGAPGGQGGDVYGTAGGLGGQGAVVSVPSLSVAGGALLYVEVGTAGQNADGCIQGAGGMADGGTGGGAVANDGRCPNVGGGGGGGASDLRTTPLASSTLTGGPGDPRLVVAGGGGGGGGSYATPGTSGGSAGGQNTGAGDGGATSCEDGSIQAGTTGGIGGGGGMTGSVTDPGICDTPPGAGTDGSASSGGTGGVLAYGGGGGGGGGFVGGGGGLATDENGSGTGGGGGSSDGPSGTSYTTAGVGATPGVVISWTLPAAPTCQTQSITTAQNTTATVTLACTANGTGNSLTYTVTSAPQHGTLGAITGDQVTYTPNAGYSGQDSFQITATDLDGQTATETIDLTVQAATPPPVTRAQTSLWAAPQVILPGWQGAGLFNVQATLTTAGKGIAGQTVTFTTGSTRLCTATTNAQGQAGCHLNWAQEAAVLRSNHYTATSTQTSAYQGSMSTTQAVVYCAPCGHADVITRVARARHQSAIGAAAQVHTRRGHRLQTMIHQLLHHHHRR